MKLSTHYYILSLSVQKCMLFEGFRDNLIDIQNTNFPFNSFIDVDGPVDESVRDTQLREFFRQTDQHFNVYFDQDPLRLVIVGEMKNLSVFESLLTHRDALIGLVRGSFILTSPQDLGKIVWPLIKNVMAGTTDIALCDLAGAASANNVVFGIDAVGLSAEIKTGLTLYVEEDYQVKGSIRKENQKLVRSNLVDINEVIDDVVDLVIEKVLQMDGNVIFMNNGSLSKFERIALIFSN